MTKKYKYAIEINEFTNSQDCKKYYFNYRSTKDICIALTENSIRVSCEMTVEYDPRRFQSCEIPLFSDAIKKSLLVYLITFSKDIKSNAHQNPPQVSFFIDDENQATTSLPVYSLIPDTLTPKMSAAWGSEKVIENILTYTPSKYDSTIASLFALICAKSKDKETERFMYLWMSINGMYNFISKCVGKATAKEREKISMMLKMYDLAESAFDSKIRRKIAKHIIQIVSENWDGRAITQESLSDSGSHEKIARAIKAKLKESLPTDSKEIAPYAYLLIELPYYFRCTYFHADEPVLLYAFEHELKCLRALNMIMESFLDRELYKYFSGEYNETYISNKLSKELSHV